MKEYDVIIIGSGSGANLVNDALSHNKTVAIVDKGRGRHMSERRLHSHENNRLSRRQDHGIRRRSSASTLRSNQSISPPLWSGCGRP
jgi:choline dehydrogenase-like flavoprotein